MMWRTVLAVGMMTTLAGALHAAPAAGNGAGLEQVFKLLDRNDDGKLTKEEAGGASWFGRVDRNKDGVVDAAEIKFVADYLAGKGSGIVLPGAPEANAAPADQDIRQGPKLVKAAERNVGRMMPDISFTDLAGKTGKLSDYKSAKALVIAFTTTSCPLTKKFAPTLAALEKEFVKQGVQFLFINPTASDTAESITAMLQAQGFQGRYVHDKEHTVTAALAARTTTEVYVLDAARTLVFRGAIDDQYGLGYSLDAPRKTYLKDALTAVLAGQAPHIAATDAPGCALEVEPATSLTSHITYHNRISRIIQNNCLECHRNGAVAPFTLASYDDVKSHAGMIRKQVERELMPPWFAAPEADPAHSPWSNDRSLSEADKRDLLAWLASDKPAGNPADAPLARVFPEGWEIGKPDLIVQIPEPIAIKATGVMPYQRVRAETTLTEDKWMQAYEIQPTAREVVHHVIVKVREKSAKAKNGGNGNDGREEREGFFAAYVPGNASTIYPEGFAKKLPAGSTLSFEIHYTPTGTATNDQLKIGIIFAKEPPKHTVNVTGMLNATISIPPGAPNHLETAKITVPFDTDIMCLMPHFHLRGKAARYEAKLPDGTTKVLLDIPRYDFNWQLKYRFAEPVRVPRGTQLIFSAWYDNSPGNPANPDPTKTVRWGQQTFEEMMLGYIEYYIPGQSKVANAKQ